MFKIAYCAGHDLNTPGKRVPKALDPAQTREWVLNDMVADAFLQAAAGYEDLAILRTDDPLGLQTVNIAKRTKKANDWGADLYIDMHHNAGINLGQGGGVVVYCCPGSEKGRMYQQAVYDAVVSAGGLKGNRANPTPEKGYASLRKTKMPAVLIEYGFMDSRTDYPVISDESYSRSVGAATMAGVAKIMGLKKRSDGDTKPADKKEVCTVEVCVLKKGDKGSQVKAMQTLLIGYGFSCGSKGADGSFGAATDKALKAFQEAKELEVDGSCGPKTWAKLLGTS